MGLFDNPTGVMDDVSGRASDVHGVLEGKHRQAPDTSSGPKTRFQNGRDLATPGGGPATIYAPPNNSSQGNKRVPVPYDSSIELLHFDTVYLDRRSTFAGATDDATTYTTPVIGARAAAFRAALERELVLLAGFVSAHAMALEDRDTNEGTGAGGAGGLGGAVGLGKILGVVGDIVGGGGGLADAPQAGDLNPFVARALAVGAQLNSASIDYDVLHQAGMDLHQLRNDYKKYLDAQVTKATTKATGSSGSGSSSPGGLLSNLPFIGNLIPPAIGDIFTLVEKLATKAVDVQVAMVLGLTQAMQPRIEMACREMSIQAITSNQTPMFAVWFAPPPPGPAPRSSQSLVNAPTTPGWVPGPLTGAVNSVLNPVQSAANTVNSGAKPLEDIVDFLSKPAKRTPGGPYLDLAFEVFDTAADAVAAQPPPAASAPPGGGGSILDGAWNVGRADAAPPKAPPPPTKIAALTCDAFTKALGMGALPGFVQSIVTHVMQSVGDFLRGVYGVLVTVDGSQKIDSAALIAAGRKNLVTQLVEGLTQGLTLLQDIRKFGFNMGGFGPLSGHLSGEALYQRAMEFLNENLLPHIDPIVAGALSGFADTLDASRATAVRQQAMTMEVYLALLPAEYTLMFRKIFFPIWDLMVKSVFAPVSQALDPMAVAAGNLAKDGRGLMDDVRTSMLRAKQLLAAAQNPLASVGTGGFVDPTKPFTQALQAHATPGADPDKPDPRKAAFPLTARVSAGRGNPISDALLQQVPAQWTNPGDGNDGGKGAGGD
jgi:hypothetical protein